MPEFSANYLSPEKGSLRERWVKQTEIDEGKHEGLRTAERLQIQREVRELRRTNAILRIASAFFAQTENGRALGL